MKTTLFFLGLTALQLHAADWTFAVVADPRSDGTTFKAAVSEIRDMKSSPNFGACQFTLCCGDQDPAPDRISDYKMVMENRNDSVPFLPVLGNHDLADLGTLKSHLAGIPGVNVKNNCSYYFDENNVRVIVVDAYNTFGSGGCVNAAGLEWVKSLITGAPTVIQHIFIALHDPAFPRVRHIGDSFDACKTDRDAFWGALVENRARVRAVFVGHTHSYYRMQVLDPASSCANNSTCYPKDAGGIYQVDAGAAGNGSKNTIVFVRISGNNVSYRTVQAPDGGSTAFSVVDEWGAPVAQKRELAPTKAPTRGSAASSLLNRRVTGKPQSPRLMDGRRVNENQTKAAGIVLDH